MKMKHTAHLFLTFLLPSILMAQQPTRHRVQSFAWKRIEVTKEWDKHTIPEVKKIITDFKEKVDSVMEPTLGMSRMHMTANRPESLLGNWAADMLVEESTATGLPRADMGLINVGGLRSSLPHGVITMGNIFLVSPFENHLVILEMKGKDLLELMQNIATVGGEGVSHGVRMEIDSEGHLLSVTLHGEKIKPRQTYTIATLDYLAEGNDKMYALRKRKKIHHTGLTIRSLMAENIIKNKIIESRLEGRITIR